MAMTATERSLARLRRIREHGGTVKGVRLSAPARSILASLAQSFGCCEQDAIEALLLGTIDHHAAFAARERLSPQEVELLREIAA